jgi:hypothetical protein
LDIGDLRLAIYASYEPEGEPSAPRRPRWRSGFLTEGAQLQRVEGSVCSMLLRSPAKPIMWALMIAIYTDGVAM